MNADPLFSLIEAALRKPLNGNVFEACANSVLMKAFPALAPMPGGDDGGMDGAFADSNGLFPLICTTQDDVLDNFRKNIASYRTKHNGQSKAIIATSRQLTNRRRRNLYKAAKDLDVQLLNIYDGAYFSEQLYRDAAWRFKLLGLTGDVPSLSRYPKSNRAFYECSLVGRELDLAWLRESKGDLLLVGQPGTGKTYLHQWLAIQEGCLFLVDDASERIANAIRSQSPSVVVVDDAHVHPGQVENLVRIRAETNASFRIHMNCWPSYERICQRILNLPNSQVRVLDTLIRSEMHALIERLGVYGSDWLQALILRQSEGKPGLAAALAFACRLGEVERVWNGEVLAQEVLGDLRLFRDEREKYILAAFAIGGDSGVSCSKVAQLLSLSVLDLKKATATLGAGGLVEEVNGESLCVRPSALRPALIKETFYDGATSLDPIPFLAACSSPRCATRELLSAASNGAKISIDYLRERVNDANDPELWESFGWLSATASQQIIDSFPGRILDAAPALLHFLPTKTLTSLLEQTAVDGATREAARRRVDDWLFQSTSLGGPLENRIFFIGILEQNADSLIEKDANSVAWSISELLRLGGHYTRPSVSDRMKFHLVHWIVSMSVVDMIVAKWPQILELVRKLSSKEAKVVFDKVEDWCFPQRFTLKVQADEGLLQKIRAHGVKMIEDLLCLPNCNRAWHTWAAGVAELMEVPIPTNCDAVYHAAFARLRHHENYKTDLQQRKDILCLHSAQIAQTNEATLLQYLRQLQHEANEFGIENSGYLWMAYDWLAQNARSAIAVLQNMIQNEDPVNLVASFISSCGPQDSKLFAGLLQQMLQSSKYSDLAIKQIFSRHDHAELLEQAIQRLDSKDVSGLSFSSQIPLETLEKLLHHQKAEIRFLAAMHEWEYSKGNVRVRLMIGFRNAVLSADTMDWRLTEILQAMPDLQMEWLKRQLSKGLAHSYRYEVTIQQALSNLDVVHRRDLLPLITRRSYDDDLFTVLIRDDWELFLDWLKIDSDFQLRLRPLYRDADERWLKYATMALDFGVPSEEIVERSHSLGREIYGLDSDHYLARIPRYEALASHIDIRLRAAGQRGLDYMRSNYEEAIKRERKADFLG